MTNKSEWFPEIYYLTQNFIHKIKVFFVPFELGFDQLKARLWLSYTTIL